MGVILAQVLAAMLVTVGVLSIMGWLRRRLLLPQGITVAVWVTTPADMDNLDILLSEAAGCEGRRAGTPMVVLIGRELLDGETESSRRSLTQVREILDRYGALLCIMEESDA